MSETKYPYMRTLEERVKDILALMPRGANYRAPKDLVVTVDLLNPLTGLMLITEAAGSETANEPGTGIAQWRHEASQVIINPDGRTHVVVHESVHTKLHLTSYQAGQYFTTYSGRHTHSRAAMLLAPNQLAEIIGCAIASNAYLGQKLTERLIKPNDQKVWTLFEVMLIAHEIHTLSGRANTESPSQFFI